MKVLISHYGILDREGFSRNFSLARGLSKLGCDVTLISVSREYKYIPFRTIYNNNVKVVVFWDFFPNKALRGGFGFISILLKTVFAAIVRFDVVQSDAGHRPGSGYPCLVNRIVYKSLYISEWWDYYGKDGIYDKRRGVYKYLIGGFDNYYEVRNRKRADGVIVLSNSMLERAISLSIPKDKITVLYGGSEVDRIQYVPSSTIKIKYGLPAGSFTFGLIGLNSEEFEELEEFQNALSKGFSPDTVNWFSIGSARSGLKPLVYGHHYEYGWIDYGKHSELLGSADVFLLLRKQTVDNIAGWPNKLGDYLAVGRPILTNAIGDIEHFCEIFPEAFIKVQNSSDAIKNIICAFLNDPESISKRNPYCRSIAENFFAWDKRAEDLLTFYRKIESTKQNQ